MAQIENLPNKYQKLVKNLFRGKAAKPQKIINMHRYISEDFYEDSAIERGGLKWQKPTRKINGKKPEGNLNVMENISDGMIDWKGRDRVTERDLRRITRSLDWGVQRANWKTPERCLAKP